MNSGPSLIKNPSTEDVQYIIASQLQQAFLRARPRAEIKSHGGLRDTVFLTEEAVWRELLAQRLRAGQVITLDDFLVLEWIPRSPGLYFTKRAIATRQTAEHHVQMIEMGERESHYTMGAEGGKVKVFDPYGKIAMLNGGIGSLRLKPRTLEGKEIYFMSASSSGTSHKALPLAMGQDLYDQCINEIAERGCFRSTVIGRLKFVPNPLADLFQDYGGVPQLYLYVEELRSPKGAPVKPTDLLVSVAVSFESSFEGESKAYASYVYFDPGRPESFTRNVGWMERVYVKECYKGTILTDFDEQMKTFAGATFSLSKVMGARLDETQVKLVIEHMHLHNGALIAQQVGVINANKQITFGDNATVGGSVVASDRIENSFGQGQGPMQRLT